MHGQLNVKLFTAICPNGGNGHNATSSVVKKIFPTNESTHPLVPCIKKFTAVYRRDWEGRLDRLILFKGIPVLTKVMPFLKRFVACLLPRRPAFFSSFIQVWFKVDKFAHGHFPLQVLLSHSLSNISSVFHNHHSATLSCVGPYELTVPLTTLQCCW